jgi:hypothetical protein
VGIQVYICSHRLNLFNPFFDAMGLRIFSVAYLSPAGKKLSQLKMDNITQTKHVTRPPFAALNASGR